MQLKIIADENVHSGIIKERVSNKFDVLPAIKKHCGISDEKIISLAKQNNALLLTEDSDFGKWVFAHKETGISVIFLRYDSKGLKQIIDALISVLTKSGSSLYGKFVVITAQKIRIRDITSL